jgi:hydrogenase nickel incorporation protein HypA/HybF
MHELAVCQALMDQVDSVARDESAARIISIHLGIGPLSGVEPGLLSQAFPIASAGSLAADAELVITALPVVVHCRECDCQSEVQPTRLLCGHCGAWQTTLVSGDEMLLERVEVIRKNSTPAPAHSVLHS